MGGSGFCSASWGGGEVDRSGERGDVSKGKEEGPGPAGVRERIWKDLRGLWPALRGLGWRDGVFGD